MRNLNLYLKVKNFAGLIKLFIKVGVLFQGILVFIREGEWDPRPFFSNSTMGIYPWEWGGGVRTPTPFLSVLVVFILVHKPVFILHKLQRSL